MLYFAAALAAQIAFNGRLDPLTTFALLVLWFGYVTTHEP